MTGSCNSRSAVVHRSQVVGFHMLVCLAGHNEQAHDRLVGLLEETTVLRGRKLGPVLVIEGAAGPVMRCILFSRRKSCKTMLLRYSKFRSFRTFVLS